MLRTLHVIDRSGSMIDLIEDVRGGFNTWVANAVKDGLEARMTVVLFDHEYEVLCADETPDRVPELTRENCFARGNTALLDATARGLVELEAVHADRGQSGDKVAVFVETDGQENSSREHTHATLRPIIERLMKAGWAFTYSGTGLTDWSDATKTGLGQHVTSNAATSHGTHSRYRGTYATTRSFAAGETRAEDFAAEVQSNIDADGGNQ